MSKPTNLIAPFNISQGSLCLMITVLGIVLQPHLALADDTASTKTTPAPIESQSAPAEKSVDDMITNANLRALSGSTSRWSLSSSFTYDGGTLRTPFAESRPNISGASATSTDTDVNGSLNVKFNLNKQSSLMWGFGIRKMAPFVSSGPSQEFYAQGGKDFDVFDPSMTYQFIYTMGPVQSVLQIGITQYTRQDIQSKAGGNLDKGISIDQENVYEIGKSGVSVGASIGVSANTPTDASRDYSKYQFWVDPYLEYQFSSLVNFRTVANVWTFEMYPTEGTVQDTYTQSVGLGFSITRDIFLYPNVQFLPRDTSVKLTNVGLTATINLF